MTTSQTKAQSIAENTVINEQYVISRAFVDSVRPQVDGGIYPSKQSIDDSFKVNATVYADGHSLLSVIVIYRKVGSAEWNESRMSLVNAGLDLWETSLELGELGLWEYTVRAWIDDFETWRRDAGKKSQAGQDLTVEIKEGLALLEHAAANAPREMAGQFEPYQQQLQKLKAPNEVADFLADPLLAQLMFDFGNRGRVAEYKTLLPVMVESKRSVYGAWYEMFPRSAALDPGRHGTFKDVIARLPYVAEMNFDVLYLPPIHPIGLTARKGQNNALTAGPADPGSPWAIGDKTGGHTAIHAQLGTIADFDALVKAAAHLQIDIALDIAFQCSPDHPYVKDHPEWFFHRPDGSIKCAENPPKKYEDIYPLNFECAEWKKLWFELKDVILFWVRHGVKIFRVDNPHTKPYAFWQWLIAEVKKQHPETIFLAEAFARPPIMRHLAKIGFSQSYTYFTWRNNKQELTEYFNELVNTEVSDYMRPNLFANTPDILNDFLQTKQRSAYMIRAALAATLGATYGIYGPVFELCVGDAEAPKGGHTEEYKDSEKYEIRHWNLEDPASISHFIAKLNAIRREQSALQTNKSLRFVDVDNDQLIAYVKSSPDKSEVILMVVNLDRHSAQVGNVNVPADEYALPATYEVHDLISNATYTWKNDRNYVRLDPNVSPVHIFRINRNVSHSRASQGR